MKKFLALILALVMALSLVACGGNTNKDNGKTGDTTELTLWTYPIGNWKDDTKVQELLAQFNAKLGYFALNWASSSCTLVSSFQLPMG